VSDCCWNVLEFTPWMFVYVYMLMGVWIGLVVLEVWMKMRKMVVFGENELHDDFEVNWCYDSMFVVVLNVFWCL